MSKHEEIKQFFEERVKKETYTKEEITELLKDTTYTEGDYYEVFNENGIYKLNIKCLNKVINNFY